jgi:hypothetical protein
MERLLRVRVASQYKSNYQVLFPQICPSRGKCSGCAKAYEKALIRIRLFHSPADFSYFINTRELIFSDYARPPTSAPFLLRFSLLFGKITHSRSFYCVYDGIKEPGFIFQNPLFLFICLFIIFAHFFCIVTHRFESNASTTFIYRVNLCTL